MTYLLFRASPRTRTILLLTLPVVAVALIASACGGSTAKASPPASTTTVPAATGTSSRAKYTACLESKGVPPNLAGTGFGGRGAGAPGTGTPGTGTRPTIPSQYAAAFQSCRSELPTGRFGAGGFNSTALTAYRNCLQVHGVTLPTTPSTTPGTPTSTPGAGGFGAGGLGAIANNPAYASARKDCASLLPTGAGRGPTTTTLPAAA